MPRELFVIIISIHNSVSINSRLQSAHFLFCFNSCCFVFLWLFLWPTSLCALYPRAHADAGPSVQHSEQPDGEAAGFVKEPDSEAETEGSVEASSGDEEAKDEGKKKKPRSGFRDRKVSNTLADKFGC